MKLVIGWFGAVAAMENDDGLHLLQTKAVDTVGYNPATDMCKIQRYPTIVQDPDPRFNVGKNYQNCKQANVRQYVIDRTFSYSNGCVRGKPCSIRSVYNAKKKYNICKCGVLHNSIRGGPGACDGALAAYTRSCRSMRLLQESTGYNPATDMCKIQRYPTIVQDPEPRFNVGKNYQNCKQANVRQYVIDRTFSYSNGCVRGKPCSIRSVYNAKKKYNICKCGVLHNSIRGGPGACDGALAAYTRSCRSTRLLQEEQEEQEEP